MRRRWGRWPMLIVAPLAVGALAYTIRAGLAAREFAALARLDPACDLPTESILLAARVSVRTAGGEPR
jgi:hypothetical protein